MKHGFGIFLCDFFPPHKTFYYVYFTCASHVILTWRKTNNLCKQNHNGNVKNTHQRRQSHHLTFITDYKPIEVHTVLDTKSPVHLNEERDSQCAVRGQKAPGQVQSGANGFGRGRPCSQAHLHQTPASPESNANKALCLYSLPFLSEPRHMDGRVPDCGLESCVNQTNALQVTFSSTQEHQVNLYT